MTFKAAIIADTHLADNQAAAQYAIWHNAVDTLRQERPDAVIVLGDLTACGNLQAAEYAVKQLDELKIPWYGTYGNADERNQATACTIRKLLQKDGILSTPWFDLMLLSVSNGLIIPGTLDAIEAWAASRGDSKLILASHYPPEDLSHHPRFRLLLEQGRIDTFLCAHVHYQKDWTCGQTQVYSVRGLDPDKTIAGPAALTWLQCDDCGHITFRTAAIEPHAPRDWSFHKKQEFLELLGFSGMNECFAAIDAAVSLKIKHLELKISTCLSQDLELLEKKLHVWQTALSGQLSVHLCDLVFSSQGRLVTQEEWDRCCRIALRLGIHRVTVHVPRTSAATMNRYYNSIIEQYSECLSCLIKAGVTIGIENLHMTDGEKADDTRGFGYLPDECIRFIHRLRNKTSYPAIGLHLDIGHARNNVPFSSQIGVSHWYAEGGPLINGMHIHQVRIKEKGLMSNHTAFDSIYGPLISLQSLFWAWAVNQLPHCPIFLEIRDDFSRTLSSRHVIERAFALE